MLVISGISQLQDSDLLSALEKCAGVYKTKTSKSLLIPELEKVVLVTASNYGYLNHWHNWKCFVDRLDMKFLVFSMDRRAHEYISSKTDSVSVFWRNENQIVHEAATEFRSQQFNIITNNKMQAVHKVLQLGFHVIFCDIDIAVVRDPVYHFRWENVDYMHSHNLICPRGDQWDFRTTPDEGNTGFYYVRSSNKTIKVWADTHAAIPHYPGLDDQTIFWNVLRASVSPPVLPLQSCHNLKNLSRDYLVSCPLDGCSFSAGALRGVAYTMLTDGLRKRNGKLFTIHANYIKGNMAKKRALETHGYWIATINPIDNSWGGICKNFTTTI